MRKYYYDPETSAFIVYNEETDRAYELPCVGIYAPYKEAIESDPDPAPVTTIPAPAKRKYTKRKAVETKATPEKKRGCDECGSPTVHRKSCSKRKEHRAPQAAGNNAWQALGDQSGKMSRMNFGRVKMAHTHDIPADTIASNLSLTEQDVNKAILAETFDDYLKA